MRIQTFSIVAGSEACNARCPFCVRFDWQYAGAILM